MTTVRRAEEADLPELGELTLAGYAEFMVGTEHDDYRKKLRDARPRFEQSEVWIAEDDDGDAGGGVLLGSVARCPLGSPWREIGREDEGEFRTLVVTPQARGRGIGKALVEHCHALFREEGMTGMALSSLPEMTSAHRLYEQLGYVRDESRDWSPAPGVELWAFSLDRLG